MIRRPPRSTRTEHTLSLHDALPIAAADVPACLHHLGSIATLIADPVLVLLHDLCKLIFQCLGNGFLFEIVESDFLRSILRHGGCPGLADEVSQRRLARREDETSPGGSATI